MKQIRIIGCVVVVLVLASSCKIQREIQNISEYKKNVTDSSKYTFYLIEGEKQFLIGNYTLAIEYMNRCINLNEQASVPYYNLSKMAYNKKNLADAKAYLDSAISREHQNIWYFKLLTQICYEQNDIDCAIRAAKEIIELDKNVIDNRLFLVDLLMNTKRYEETIAVYNEMERDFGYNEKFTLEKIKIYDLLGKNEEAINELQKLIQKHPENAYYYGLLAEFYVEDIEYEKALKAYEKVQELDPENGVIHLSMFEFYARIGEQSKAKEQLEIAMKSKMVPVESKIQTIYRIENFILKDSVESVKQRFTNYLVKQYKNEPKIILLWVDMLMKEEKYETAKSKLEEVVDTLKDNFFIWQQLVLIENITNDNKKLNKFSEQALEIFPNQAVFYLFNGIALYNLKKYNESINILESGLDYSTGNLEIYKQILTYIGESYYKLGNKKDAYVKFDKVLEIDSNNTFVLNNYSYYLSLEERELERAKVMIEKCLIIDSSNSSYLDTYAWVLFKLKSYKKALTNIENAYANGGNKSKVIVDHFGDILFMNNFKNQAIEKWKEAQLLGDNSEQLKDKILRGLNEK